MSTTVNGTTGVTFPDGTNQNTSASGFGFKNRIINGAFMIDQRNNGASVTATTSAPYTVDRWMIYGDVNSKFTAQQNAGSVTPPSGFKNYLGLTSSSAYSVPAGEIYVLQQKIEGLNAADLGWGAAGASTVTLSFWVRSSLTGTFGGSIKNSDGSRSYPFSYTISAAGSWEQKSITIAGDTSGTWLTTNGVGLNISFGMGVGSTYSGTAGAWASANYLSATGATSVVGTNGATFYITGVQLEKGSTATSFDYRPYGSELALCQRYYQSLIQPTDGYFYNITNGTFRRYVVFLNGTMRATPTGTVTGVTGNSAGPNIDGTPSNTAIQIGANAANSTDLVKWTSSGLVTASAEL